MKCLHHASWPSSIQLHRKRDIGEFKKRKLSSVNKKFAVIEIGQQADSNWVLFSNAHLSASGALVSMEHSYCRPCVQWTRCSMLVISASLSLPLTMSPVQPDGELEGLLHAQITMASAILALHNLSMYKKLNSCPDPMTFGDLWREWHSGYCEGRMYMRWRWVWHSTHFHQSSRRGCYWAVLPQEQSKVQTEPPCKMTPKEEVFYTYTCSHNFRHYGVEESPCIKLLIDKQVNVQVVFHVLLKWAAFVHVNLVYWDGLWENFTASVDNSNISVYIHILKRRARVCITMQFCSKNESIQSQWLRSAWVV